MNTENTLDGKSHAHLHAKAVQAIAQDTEVPIDKVKSLYEIVLKSFEEEAKVKDFLPLLVSKRVRYLLNKISSDKRGQS